MVGVLNLNISIQVQFPNSLVLSHQLQKAFMLPDKHLDNWHMVIEGSLVYGCPSIVIYDHDVGIVCTQTGHCIQRTRASCQMQRSRACKYSKVKFQLLFDIKY